MHDAIILIIAAECAAITIAVLAIIAVEWSMWP